MHMLLDLFLCLIKAKFPPNDRWLSSMPGLLHGEACRSMPKDGNVMANPEHLHPHLHLIHKAACLPRLVSAENTVGSSKASYAAPACCKLHKNPSRWITLDKAHPAAV